MSASGDYEAPNGIEYVLENDEAITELLLDATDLAMRLGGRRVPTDCLVGLEKEVRRSIFRKRERVIEYVEGWDLHGCEPAGVESMALSKEGVIYLNSTEPLYGDGDQVPVMPVGYELSDVHFMTFARVDEIRSQLEGLAAVHGE
ncbi:MAG TPA: hypothetical protein VLE51_02925 [Candidatus Saccharimonadales bacterium]|nr:hypothetical protein [Candidatus Saccharimonadales bacterium]